MSYSLNSLKGIIQRTIIGVIKGDTRRLDYRSHARRYTLGQTEVDASVNLAASGQSSTEGGSFPWVRVCIWGVSQNKGYPFGGPNNKDYCILGVYIGVPLFWETTISTARARSSVSDRRS